MKKTRKFLSWLLSVTLIAVVIFAVLKTTGNTYTVTFETNSGITIEAQTVKKGEKIESPENPTKENHLFLGWYSDELLENEFDFDTVIDKDYTLYAKYLDLSDKTDTDSDGLTDALEDYYGTDKSKSDTDEDLLSDFWEITLELNPLKKDSDDNGTEDASEDYDGDGISNIDEINGETSPVLADTDGDNLNDGEEINTHKTNPQNADTDGDGANDCWEIANNFDPKELNDTFSVSVENGGATVEMNASGKSASTITVEKIELGEDFSTISGFLNSAYEFTTMGEFEVATIKIPYYGKLSDTFQPRIYYYNESEQIFEELENQTVENGYIIAEVTHFSVYGAIDKFQYDNSWTLEETDIDKAYDSNDDGISDYYARLIKEGKLLSSKGDRAFKGIDFDLNPDYDGDGIPNGKEIVIIEKGYLGRAYYIQKSNPISIDTDGDGIRDGDEEKGHINLWDVSLRDLVLLADIVYESYKVNTIISDMSFNTTLGDASFIVGSARELKGWRVVATCDNHFTGYQAYVYEKDGKIVIASRGSEDLLKLTSPEFYQDWLLADGLGFISGANPQLSSMRKFIKEISDICDSASEIYVTGHSLGGYLTLMTSSQLVKNGYGDKIAKVTTFNSLGLSVNIFKELDDNANLATLWDKTLNYRTVTDPISILFGYHPGVDITIPMSEFQSGWSVADSHSLISFIERFANDIRHPSYEAFRNGLNDEGLKNEPDEPYNPPVDTDTDTNTDIDIDTDVDVDTDIGTDTDTDINTDTDSDNPSDEPPLANNDLIYEYDEERDCYKVVDIGGYKDSVLVIPGEYKGKPVKIIGKYAFYGCFNIQKVVLSEGIEVIEEAAFMHCPYLKTLVTCSTLYSVATDAFTDCWRLLEVYNLSPMITDYDFENNYLKSYVKMVHTSIDDESIYYEENGFVFAYMYHNYSTGWHLIECKSNDYRIFLPPDCKGENYSIYDYAFYAYPEYTNLTSLVIPQGVTSINGSAFFNNIKLVEIYNLSNLRINVGYSNHGKVSSYAKVVHKSITDEPITEKIGDYVFATIDGEKYLMTYLGNEKNITLPTLEENYKIYQGAFYMSHIESVVIPDGVTEIGNRAFDSCYNLLSVTIPQSVTYMNYAFNGATTIAEIYNYSGVEILPKGEGTSVIALVNTRVVHTSPEESVIDRVGDFVFVTANGTNYLVAYLGNDANVKLPQSYKGEKYTVSQGCFAFKKIKSITIPKNVSCIENTVFYENQRLENVYFEDTEGWYYIDMSGKKTNIGSSLLETGEGGYQAVNEYAWYHSIYNE